MNRRILFMITVLILLAAVSLSAVDISQAAASFSGSEKLPVIIIDPGHGGFDGGAVASDGTIEKDINLSISLKLQRILSLSGYEVIMTRSTDTGTDYSESYEIKNRKVADMKNRLKLMNSRDDCIFVSIHLNKFESTAAKGAQVFYAPSAEGSKELGESIQKSIVSMLQPENERKIKPGTKSTYLLYYAERPAVIVECGFLSNPAELGLLKDETYQQQIAFAVSCGIADYFS